MVQKSVSQTIIYLSPLKLTCPSHKLLPEVLNLQIKYGLFHHEMILYTKINFFFKKQNTLVCFTIGFHGQSFDLHAIFLGEHLQGQGLNACIFMMVVDMAKYPSIQGIGV